MQNNKILNVAKMFPHIYLLQPKLVSKTGKITQMLNNNFLPSMIFYGPPGCGKTMLATYMATKLDREVIFLNASYHAKKDFEKVVKDNAIIFIDEIHNLDKKKQDFLMYLMDSRDICIIGATTQNTNHSLNRALRSRMMIIEFEKIDNNTMKDVLMWHLTKMKYWFNDGCKVIFENSDQTLNYFFNLCGGDLRKMLSSFEIIVKSTNIFENEIVITKQMIKEQLKNNYVESDNMGDITYDLLSALQKSIRGSHVDAALYYLSKLIVSNDLTSIVRRLRVIVYEDIGFANLELISRTLQGLDAAIAVGFPEAKIILSLIVSELSLSPKDNSSYLAIKEAMNFVQNNPNSGINDNIKHYNSTYKYIFDYDNNFINQDYLPSDIRDINFLEIHSQVSSAQRYEKRRKLLRKLFLIS